MIHVAVFKTMLQSALQATVKNSPNNINIKILDMNFKWGTTNRQAQEELNIN